MSRDYKEYACRKGKRYNPCNILQEKRTHKHALHERWEQNIWKGQTECFLTILVQYQYWSKKLLSQIRGKECTSSGRRLGPDPKDFLQP
jgi:hypothetical protein